MDVSQDMDKALLFLSVYVAFSSAADSAKGRITATHGGVVLLGNTLTLSYKAETNWTVCFWYRHETPTRYQYCIFIWVEGQLLKNCSSEAFKDRLEIGRNDSSTCSIKIQNVTEEDNATWSVKVDAELTSQKINVIVAVKPNNLVIKSAPIKAGTNGKVSCHVTGGRPPPLVLHQFEEVSGVPSPEINSTITKSIDDKGHLALNKVIFIKPTIMDHDRKVYCEAVQKVKHKQLFEPLKAQLKLNVTFQPWTRSNGQGSEENPLVFGDEAGKDLEVNIRFFANPRPDSVSWKVSVFIPSA